MSATGQAHEIRARGIVRGKANGSALVSTEAIAFLGDLDIRTGVIGAVNHPLYGQSVAGRVLVMPRSVGSAGAWRFLYQLFVHRTHPVAIAQQVLPDSSLVQGAILAGIPIVCEPSENLFAAISTDDEVEIDGTSGLIRVLRKSAIA